MSDKPKREVSLSASARFAVREMFERQFFQSLAHGGDGKLPTTREAFDQLYAEMREKGNADPRSDIAEMGRGFALALNNPAHKDMAARIFCEVLKDPEYIRSLDQFAHELGHPSSRVDEVLGQGIGIDPDNLDPRLTEPEKNAVRFLAEMSHYAAARAWLTSTVANAPLDSPWALREMQRAGGRNQENEK